MHAPQKADRCKAQLLSRADRPIAVFVDVWTQALCDFQEQASYQPQELQKPERHMCSALYSQSSFHALAHLQGTGSGSAGGGD